ncbi:MULTISPECIES: SCO family protein [unclassified Rhizobium]|uniref:SCO family protein n=1 Tax=unclassified Rhizobium TaxID=2613769 RepID=UPI00381D847B
MFDRDCRSKWLLVFFGDAHCTDICPISLGKIAESHDELGPLADRFSRSSLHLKFPTERERNLPLSISACTSDIGALLIPKSILTTLGAVEAERSTSPAERYLCSAEPD